MREYAGILYSGVAPRLCGTEKAECRTVFVIWIYSYCFSSPSFIKWKAKDKIVKHCVKQTTENWVLLHREVCTCTVCRAPCNFLRQNQRRALYIYQHIFPSAYVLYPQLPACFDKKFVCLLLFCVGYYIYPLFLFNCLNNYFCVISAR